MKLNAAFWKWFGDSKVIKNGKPLPVYHGTDADFTAFTKQKGSVVTFLDSEEVDRTGFFFTPNKEFAKVFSKSGRVLKCYLSIKNPADFTTNEDFESFLEDLEDEGVNRRWILTGDMWEKFDGEQGQEFVTTLIDMGYDGAKIDETDDDGKNVVSWIAFYPKQIKSVDNDGTWDADDADIRSNPEVNDMTPCLTGKCLVFAKRIREEVGGVLFDVVEPENSPGLYYPGLVHHVVVKVGNKYVDGTGEWTKDDLLDFWKKRANHFERRNIDFVLEPHNKGRAKDQGLKSK